MHFENEQKSNICFCEVRKEAISMSFNIEQLYGKIVPQNVRDYIEMLAASQKPRQRRSAAGKDKPEQQDGV